MSELRLEELSATNAVQAKSLELRPGQEQFANPATYIAAEPQIDPSKAWAKVILVGDEVVGLVRAYFDDSYPEEELQSCVWNISVSATAQGAGVGRFAIDAVIEEARARGVATLTVMWEEAAGGPGEFFTRMGFVDSGETAYGDRIGVLTLSD
jgi:diamine N-acetyltransferase